MPSISTATLSILLETKTTISVSIPLLHHQNHRNQIHNHAHHLIAKTPPLLSHALLIEINPMAKAKNKSSFKSPKPKTSIFLCCFGSPAKKDSLESATKDSDPIIPIEKQKKTYSWFSRIIRIRMQKNSASKTVPLEAHYSKARSTSTLLEKSLAPADNSPPLTQTLPVHPATPYYTPSQTRHGASNSMEDTRQQGRGSPTLSKRQVRRPSSSSMQPQTTSSKKRRNARGSYDPVVGMSVVVVTLVIMVFWGRLFAILCTSAWLYYIPRFRKRGADNDESGDSGNKQNDVPNLDLDSEEYKKKVIMEGLLERNHRGTSK